MESLPIIIFSTIIALALSIWKYTNIKTSKDITQAVFLFAFAAILTVFYTIPHLIAA